MAIHVGDEVDVESLQAQIDLSMSFTQDLVSSWVKPSYKASMKSRKDTEKELEEYMRRPPRLGVGAPIPESVGMSRETARLKSRLTSQGANKRVREEEDKLKQPSDDEEESRTGAIRKKAKLDVFGSGKSKKKKMQGSGVGLPTPQATPPTQTETRDNAMEVDDNTKDSDPADISIASPGSLHTPRKKKKKRAMSTVDATIDRAPLAVPPQDRIREQHRISVSPITKTAAVPQHRAVTPVDMTDKNNLHADSSSVATPGTVSPHRVSHLSSPSKLPLLNLDGPPGSADDIHDCVSKDTNPKRKRKRRKKKRPSLTNTGPDDTISDWYGLVLALVIGSLPDPFLADPFISRNLRGYRSLNKLPCISLRILHLDFFFSLITICECSKW